MHGLAQLTVVQRFSNLPVIKTSIDKATDIYVRVKKSNRIIQWSLETAEATVTIAVDISASTLPVVLLDGPIHLIDEILCKSLDMVEEAAPIIKQPPNEIYLEAKKVVTSVMEPVLKRADSVKEISITYSNKAAESIDNVLTAADGIVDKYLPEISDGSPDEKDGSLVAVSNPPRNPAEKTILHLSRTSRTLKRRLTQRTLYEARALKKQGQNIVHVMLVMTDMLAKDPKQFVQRMKELWHYLSADEPENQEPPQNLEELIVMLTRESARRLVHIANFITYNTVKIPQYAHDYMNYALSKYSDYINSLNLKSSGIKRQAEILKHSIQNIFEQFLNMVKHIMPGYSESGSSNSSSRPAIEEKSKKSNESQANKGKKSGNPHRSKTGDGGSTKSNESQYNGAVVQTVN